MGTVQNTGNYNILIDKLDRFIRKYYLNKCIRGTLYWLALTLGIFLVYNALEYNYFFSQGIRKFLFFSFVGIGVAMMFYWVLSPLFSLVRLGRRISHEQAASIIGDHFADVKDKLLNVLQLHRQAENTPSPELAFASIQQKTAEIQVIPFKKAIDLTQNRKYLRYALPPMLILLALLVAAPSVIRDGTTRIIRNNENFERDAPFHFTVQDEDELQVVQYEEFILHVGVDGSVLPDEVFINVDDYQYRLKKESSTRFSYRFKNVHKNTDFNLFAGSVASPDYTLEVLKKPNLLSFDVKLDYPAYTGRRDETLSNIGDLVVPTGTAITWDLNTLNTHQVSMLFDEETSGEVKRQGNDLFSYRKPVYEDQQYTLFLSNDNLPIADSIQYSINVIPDLYPKISVEQFVDSLDERVVYFVGSAGDDYGVSNLTFNYQIIDDNQEQKALEAFPLTIKHRTQFQYDYTFDINQLELKPGYQLTYYFEVFDNDAINGAKATKSSVMHYRKPSVEEFEQQEEANSEQIKQSLQEARKESQKLQEQMQKLREKLLQEKDVNWQNKKELEKIIDRQKELQEEMQNAQDLFEQNLQNQEEYENPSQDLQEKQQKLQEFFEDLMDEETREMMEKLSEMMDELQKEDMLEMLENFEFNEEELQKELERLEELFKQMELEQELQEQLEKLGKLAEQEEELSEKTRQAGEENEQQQEQQQEQSEEQQQSSEEPQDEQEEQESSNETLSQEQEEIQQQLEEIAKELEGLEEKNKELENPKDLDQTNEEMERIDQDMENSQQQLQQNQNNKASESQKKAAQRMRDLAQQMSMQMMQGQMMQIEEDMESLRQLLENLITLSFDQEDVIDELAVTHVATPRYVGLVQDQFKIQDDFKLVEDTLQALSKRVIQIESFVSEKVTEIKTNMHRSLNELEDRKTPTAADFQQRTMTSLNDLALMLSEVMNQMQQQMSMMMPGNQMCNNPGSMPGKQSGRVPLDKITEGQQQLNEDMKGMQKGMQEGQKGSSEQFARMAARQAALRKALRDLQGEKQQRGQGDPLLENAINQMDKIEIDLVNKRLTNEMMKRQQEILTRLLEAEKAERERQIDNERKAESTRQQERKLPPSLEEYIKQREAEVESFQTVSPSLLPYYKFLVEEYYDALKKQ